MEKYGYRFSFGPWNIHEGADPFGPPVRPAISFEDKLPVYKDLNFDAVQFHDDDVVPGIDELAPAQIERQTAAVKRILADEGLVAEFVAPRTPLEQESVDFARLVHRSIELTRSRHQLGEQAIRRRVGALHRCETTQRRGYLEIIVGPRFRPVGKDSWTGGERRTDTELQRRMADRRPLRRSVIGLRPDSFHRLEQAVQDTNSNERPRRDSAHGRTKQDIHSSAASGIRCPSRP